MSLVSVGRPGLTSSRVPRTGAASRDDRGRRCGTDVPAASRRERGLRAHIYAAGVAARGGAARAGGRARHAAAAGRPGRGAAVQSGRVTSTDRPRSHARSYARPSAARCDFSRAPRTRLRLEHGAHGSHSTWRSTGGRGNSVKCGGSCPPPLQPPRAPQPSQRPEPGPEPPPPPPPLPQRDRGDHHAAASCRPCNCSRAWASALQWTKWCLYMPVAEPRWRRWLRGGPRSVRSRHTD
jgi:hypothetical protein